MSPSTRSKKERGSVSLVVVDSTAGLPGAACSSLVCVEPVRLPPEKVIVVVTFRAGGAGTFFVSTVVVVRGSEKSPWCSTKMTMAKKARKKTAAAILFACDLVAMHR